MTYLIIAAFLSGVGMMFVFLRRLPEVMAMSGSEFLKRFRSSSPTMKGLHSSVLVPAGTVWRTVIRPLFFALVEAIIRRFASLVAKFEVWLKQFGDYIHGKSQPKGNGGSDYWNGMNNFKNGLKGE